MVPMNLIYLHSSKFLHILFDCWSSLSHMIVNTKYLTTVIQSVPYIFSVLLLE